ncbi:MAG: TonB-dependent receptor [Saprospiraceae bacterium]|nr:TonB-dependent receptor [Saprospiraceae bacterium]
MKKHILLSTLAMLTTAFVFAQRTGSDSIAPQTLREISIKAERETILRMPQLQGTYLWAGKKSEVISLQNMDANIAEKTPRQIFAKVPGVFVYDMDGTGNQMNISTRGLDPHRGWEFNIRADGVMTNSDIYGYPASHFSLPMEAIGRIELVRGTGALQYGAQFGGMLNYVLKQPDTTRQFGAETINSAGSYGLMSTYTAIGGKIGKLQYYAYYSKRVSDGYRRGSHSDFDGQGVVLKYMPTAKFALKAELLRSNYLYRIPGPLTDAMFEADPRQATRSRNYFNPEIYVPSLSAEWEIAPRTHLSWTASGVLGERRSVMFDRTANIADTILASTRTYGQRQVDIDHFQSFTTELRLLQEYTLFGQPAALSAGVQYINNDLHRRQQGKGSTGTDYDLTITADGWGRDIHLKSQNIALFAENKFQFGDRFSISPGLRFESGTSNMSGNISYLPPLEVPNTIKHQFPLFGVNAEYQLSEGNNLYAGWSQAYRPVIFKDIVPGNFYERADKDLKDAYGYNMELGWRGTYKNFKWDISAFNLVYNNRLGSLTEYSAQLDTLILFRTNIGNSRTSGLELFVEYGVRLSEQWSLTLFSSSSYFDARYQGDSVRVSSKENRSIKGKRVESVPEWISRNGATLKYKTLSVSLLYSYTAVSYADPLNTETPSATGAVGLVPAYGLLDLNLSWRLLHNLTLRCSLNNLSDKQYFTKRPSFYPGPGVWPSDGRSLVVSLGVRL